MSFGLAGAFVLSAGLAGSASVSAQDWRRDRWERERREQQREESLRNRGWDGRVDRNGNVDLNRNGVDDRYENNRGVYRNGRVDRNRNGVDDRYETRRSRDGRYRNDGYYGNDGYGYYGYNGAEEQMGYRDGLDRGRKDAQTNRAMDPNNSSHYRNGSAAYRAGFERGFYESYRQYRNYRW
jgi:hypothetical protein